MSQEWDIKPRGEACSDCQKPFVDKQSYHALLAFVQDEGYARSDFCAECWPKHEGKASPTSTWQGTFRMPPPPPEEALKKETAEGMLRRLMADEDETKINPIYILAVMLERKRVLIERDVQKREDGTTIRVYEHRQSGETFLIPEPHLRLDELEHVQEEVVQLLGGKPKKAPDAAEQGDSTEKPEEAAEAEEPTAADND